jgi:integrase
LLELEQASVDLARGVLTVERGKSKAARRLLRLRAESREILARRLSAGGRWVFPSPRCHGQHLTKLNERHGDVLKDCELSFVPYDLRHTFATRAADAGMPLATLARILGHSNLRSVLKYVHPQQADMDRELERLDAPVADRNADSEIHGPTSGQHPQLNTAKNRQTQVSAANPSEERLSARKIN